MSWFAVDDRFWSHRKVMSMRRSPYYTDAVALWALAGSWCCGQAVEQYDGRVPLDVLPALGVTAWRDALDLLVEAGLWEVPDGDAVLFHDWHVWNGAEAKHNRSNEQARIRTAAWRKRKCERGEHDRHCPSETCPKKAAKRRVAVGDVTPGRDGTGTGRSPRPREVRSEEEQEHAHERANSDPWKDRSA
jgi:hypothetical protein